MSCMEYACGALKWRTRCFAISGARLAMRMKKSIPYMFYFTIHLMSDIHHVTQVRFAASVPEGKSRTSVLKSGFTLSGGIIQQQLPGTSTAFNTDSPPIIQYERPRLHPAHQDFLAPTNCPAGRAIHLPTMPSHHPDTGARSNTRTNRRRSAHAPSFNTYQGLDT